MPNRPLPDNNHFDLYIKMKSDVFQEHLRQARQIFNLSFVTLTASIGSSAIGSVLLIYGKST
ncbi:TRADD-N-associated membrane domain-containing protein [Nostoc sp. CALU 1950]|uniref:TRADD-N-associated membrane domain-containing protein n=1 Tax=Nostoc sp. CALU 1950 TaxID=3104321 RepID=UPI003EB88A8E